MSGVSRNARPPPGSGSGILLGILRVALGKTDGIAQFSAGRQAFLTSLAPLIAFPLVGAGLLASHGSGLLAGEEFLATLVMLLSPPVISFELARWWKREAAWWRYATAFNWCQWAIPVVATVILSLAGLAMGAGLPNRVAAILAMAGLVGYALWLHWFLARHGLGLSRLRAVALVLCVNLITALLAVGPQLLVMPDAIGGKG